MQICICFLCLWEHVWKDFFLLNRAWLGQNSVSIKTSFTKLTINFFYLTYYVRYLITKPLPLNHLVVYCLTNSNGFTKFFLSKAGANKLVLLLIKQGELMNMNCFLLIKDVSEWTFYSSEYTQFIRISCTWLEKIFQMPHFLYQWKCISSQRSALLAQWTVSEERQLLRGVLIETPLGIIFRGSHFMRKVIRLRVLAKYIFWPIGLWQWHLNITITILDIIHRPVFYLKLNSDI
jgi:hypothetical protein